jgi:signal peptidase I
LVFVPPSERSSDWKKYTGFFDPRKKYIKRVIALPGETIKLENHKIFIKKIGKKEFEELNEPYIKNSGTTKNIETVLKPDEYFMLGDNRASSYDSEE